MAWEPITLTEDDVRAFAEQAIQFCDTLDDRSKALWHEVVDRAGGDGHAHATQHPPGGNGSASACNHEHLGTALNGVWEPGTTIAPLYSGDMPNEGGGTVD